MLKNKNGFTLIETIIAVFILIIGILGSYTVFYDIYSKSGGLSHKLTAAYLSQEGIEVIRNMRDNNWVKNNSNWLSKIAESNNCSNGCDFEVDYKTGTSYDLNQDIGLMPYGTSGDFLNINGDGLYSYDSNSPETIFKRKITITTGLSNDSGSNDIFGSSDIFKVDSTVSWQYKGKEFFVKIVDFLYNWY